MAFRSKKELCRNFQRGSCQYGERCKFSHATQPQQQQQQRPSNPFGFGAQQPQNRASNTFGFGTQPKSNNDFGNRQQQQFKPFENKWTRSSTVSSGGGNPSRQSDTQSQAANHKCTDPESCKRQIAEDFEHEKPLWKLTCYGHVKNGPCDIHGDVSYEELRAAAYDEARRGLNFQSIVERERNLLNSKLMEFQNLLRNPYVAPSKSALSLNQNPFTSASPTALLTGGEHNAPPSVSSFSQLGSSLNMDSRSRPPAPSNQVFGQQNLFSNSTSSGSGIRPSLSPNNVIAQPSIFNNSSQTSGSIGGQQPYQASGNLFSSNTAGVGNSGAAINPFCNSSVPKQVTNSSTAQPAAFSGVSSSASNAVGQVEHIQSINSSQTGGDRSIWLKESWKAGEIPEEAPPDDCI